MNALQPDEQPDSVLNAHGDLLNGAWHSTAAAITEDGHTTVDVDGRVHVGHDEALGESASLVELRRRTSAMLPRLDLPEVILEAMAEYPALAESFTAVSGSGARLKDLDVSIAALLTAHSLNIGFGPVLADAEPLTRDRLAHVDQHYLRPENETVPKCGRRLVRHRRRGPTRRSATRATDASSAIDRVRARSGMACLPHFGTVSCQQASPCDPTKKQRLGLRG